MIYFTADTHFGHDNIRKYTNRPFATVDEMDAKLIENWNKVVKPNDTTYVLGDFSYRNGRSVAWYRWQLNGNIILIVGNHDDLRAIRRAAEEVRDGEPPKPLFKEIVHGFTTFRQQVELPPNKCDKCGGETRGKRTDISIVLCHYAMRSWDQSHHGSWHLFGHTHGRLPSQGKSFDIGVDCHNYRPLSLHEVVEKMQALPDNPDLVAPRRPDDTRPWSDADIVARKPGAGGNQGGSK